MITSNLQSVVQVYTRVRKVKPILNGDLVKCAIIYAYADQLSGEQGLRLLLIRLLLFWRQEVL